MGTARAGHVGRRPCALLDIPRRTGLFDRLAADAPFDYTSNNACSKRDILGSAVLAILLGKTRYVHINELRHDEAGRVLVLSGYAVSKVNPVNPVNPVEKTPCLRVRIAPLYCRI